MSGVDKKISEFDPVVTLDSADILPLVDLAPTPTTYNVSLTQLNTFFEDTTQTFQNKSIDLLNNTLTGTTAQFNTALSDDDFATLTNSVTLTNKTLTDPIFDNDLLINSGGIINFDSSDVTLTHSSGTLSLAASVLDLQNTTADLWITGDAGQAYGSTIRFLEGGGDYWGGYIAFQGSTNIFEFGTHDSADSSTANDDIAFQIDFGSSNIITHANIIPNANDGGAIGASGTAFSDLFLASGAVINFNAGDVTLTHSANDLAIAGGDLTMSDGDINLGNNQRITFDDDQDTYIYSTSDNTFTFRAGGTFLGTWRANVVDFGTPIRMGEVSAAVSDQAGYLQIWVKDDAPNILKITDDAGTDFTPAMLESANTWTANQIISGSLTANSILAGSNDSGALGASGTAFSDLFLASGAVINFNAGDVTLTHSANTLTFDGGTLALGSNTLTHSGTGTLTGTYDFGGATSVELPNSITPTVNADGEIAVDTSVTDFSAGVLKYYSGEEMGVVAMPIAQFTSPTNTYVVSYNSTNDEFELVAAGAGTVTSSGSPLNNEIAVFSSGTDINSDSTFTWDGTTFTATNTTIDAGGVDIGASDSYAIAGTDVISDSAGTATLSNIDALDATTEATIEAAIDTLSNLTAASALATVGTITSGTWQATDVGIAYGGTGASTAGAAKDNLGGGWDLISTTTFTTDLTFEVTDLSSTYFMYRFVFDHVDVDSDIVDFRMRTDSDNGASFDAGASDYAWVMSRTSMATSPSTSLEGDDSDSFMTLLVEAGTSTNEYFNCDVWLFNPSDTAAFTGVYSHNTMLNKDGNNYGGTSYGHRKSTAGVDAVQFYMSSGNLLAGTVKVYGLRA